MVHTERIVPAETPVGIFALHLKRYQFARKYVGAKQRVLDLACGVGYGSCYLADGGMHVVGADIDVAAVRYAKDHYSGPENLAFIQTDAMCTALADSYFHVVCSFETIEHVQDVNLYLSEVKRVLMPDGVFIVSTPQVRHSDSRPNNPFHHREWSSADFIVMLRGYFNNVEIFGQSRRETRTARWIKRLDVLNLRTRLFPIWLTRRLAGVAGVRTMADLHLEDVVISRGHLPHASEIVAVAKDAD